MGPPERRSKATWGRYPDFSKADVLFNAQKALRASGDFNFVRQNQKRRLEIIVINLFVTHFHEF